MTHVKRILADQAAHCEPRAGTREQARDYCTRANKRAPGEETGPWEVGEWRDGGQGRRTDLACVHELLKSGCPEVDISDEYFETWCRYFNSFVRWRAIHTEPRNWKTQVSIYWGPPGTGKSSLAAAEARDPYWLPPPRSSSSAVWWEGYNGQGDVIIDDFYGSMPYQTLLRIMDRYPMKVETKHGSFEFSARRLWITSNQHPLQWYPQGDRYAFMRRVEVCQEFIAFHESRSNPDPGAYQT